MTFEAIILAGGLGTRLRPALPDLPKAIAPIGGRPFLTLLLDRLAAAGCARVVLATGYLRHLIAQTIGNAHLSMEVTYSEEETPLGTGGAVLKAFERICTKRAVVMNGDTWLDVDYGRLLLAHLRANAAITVSLVAASDCGRFGSVLVKDDRVVEFCEKNRSGPGLINAGVYVIERDAIEARQLENPFSLEAGFLAKFVAELRPLAFKVSGRFIDIGIPQDYVAARELLIELQRRES